MSEDKYGDVTRRGNGAVTSGQSCHRKGLLCHMADRVHMTGLVLSHGEQSCNRTGWCCHMADRVVTGREWYLSERSGHSTGLVVLPVTDRVPKDGNGNVNFLCGE